MNTETQEVDVEADTWKAEMRGNSYSTFVLA